jgi:hypothetical protein
MNEQMAKKGCQENGRRRFLTRLSIVLGSLSAALLAIPSVGFLLGLRKSPRLWRTVGKLGDFKVGSTVNVSFDDTSPLPWSGVTAQTAANLSHSRWCARISAVRSAGWPTPICSCAPVMAACSIATAAWPPDPRRNL